MPATRCGTRHGDRAVVTRDNQGRGANWAFRGRCDGGARQRASKPRRHRAHCPRTRTCAGAPRGRDVPRRQATWLGDLAFWRRVRDQASRRFRPPRRCGGAHGNSSARRKQEMRRCAGLIPSLLSWRRHAPFQAPEPAIDDHDRRPRGVRIGLPVLEHQEALAVARDVVVACWIGLGIRRMENRRRPAVDERRTRGLDRHCRQRT